MSDLRRWYQYVRVNDDGVKKYEPAMCIAAKRPRASHKNAFIISLGAAYKYLMDDAKSVEYMKKAVQFIHEHLDIGDVVSPQKFAETAWFIQDGLDELVKMPPKLLKKAVVGDGEMSIGGKRTSFDVNDYQFHTE